MELALSGARAEAAAGGVRLRLEGSERVLAYSRLRVEDATGRELTARLEVLSPDRLAVSVADANATYPVRIDPTFSDADWVSLNPGIPGADGPVFAIVADRNSNVYVGGGFTSIGMVAANFIAKWDGHAWSALGSGMDNSVTSLAVIGTNLYAGGYSSTAGGVPISGIAKWDGHAWSSVGSGVGGVVSALAVIGTDLYAGGGFAIPGSVGANCVAKWNGSTWSVLGSGMGGITYPYVYALAVNGTILYAGGYFTTAGGVQASNIAKWDGSAWSALGSGFSQQISGQGLSVNALAVIGTNLYAGGHFTTAGGVTANSIAKWDGRAWSALGSGISDPYSAVNTLAVNGTDLYAGGGFTAMGSVPANYLAKWDGRAWSALGSEVNAGVYALAMIGADLYAGGWFTTAGGGPANYIAKWHGSAWSPLGSGMNADVYALAVSGTNLYAGGAFTTTGGGVANYIAKWHGSFWSALGSGMSCDYNCIVRALAVSGSHLCAGGYFTNAGGVTANCIAKWNGNAWSALGSGMNGEVTALLVSGTNIYAGGYFTAAGGVPANAIAKWDGSGWSALGSGLGGVYPYQPCVYALAVSETNLYVGGLFTTAGGVSANYIAKWDGNGWSSLGSGLGASYPYNNPCVYALAVSETNLYAGGLFTTAGRVTANCIAKWDGSAWSALGSGMSDQQVFALEVSGANLYAGGWFTTVGGAPANHIAKWDGGAWSTVGSGMDHAAWALAADGTGHLFVGGYFSLAGTNVSPFIAEANLGSAPTILRVSPTQTAEAGAPVYLTVHAAGYSPPAYQWYFNGTNLLSCTSSNLVLTNILFSQSGTYTVVVTNMFGAVTSAPVMLNVLAPVVHRLVPGVELIAPVGTFWGLDYRDNLGLTANWETMATMSLSNASQFYFDLSAPLPSQRFYRAWKSGTPSLRPSLDLHLVPAITLTGNIGDSVRVEAINQFGPIDAWFTLDTVTLTNTSQLYFDVSALGQPPRLYRLPQGDQSQIVYAAAGAVYTQNFDSLPDPGLTSVNSANPVTINGITYSLSNPFDFAFPVSTSGTNGGLGLSSLAGWYGLADPTASVGTRFGATDGDQTTGGQISFGLPNSLNRALGLLATSTTGYTVFGAKFVNGTGQTLNFINLQFTGEVWRQSDTAKTLECYYFIDPSATNVFSTNATAFLPALNVSFPTVPADVGGVAVDGTSYLNQTNLAVVNQVITNWVPGAALWLVWEMADASGKSQGLAIDNLSFSASAWPTGM